MKIQILLIFIFFNISTIVFCQERTIPLTDTEIIRNVSSIDIEGIEYKNVKVIMKSISPDYVFSDKYKVKVTIEDMDGKKVWKKTLKNDYLYVFSKGEIQVGRRNFTKILIYKNEFGSFIGMVREKEGIY
tara:strand:+ start:273 stop:662 length:390 start_codon:yes stop_codon:yes gene_type:complete